MDEKYFAKKIENKWQKRWVETGYFDAEAPAEGDARPKFYQLEMLPYPSGNLHLGHMLVYTIGDVVTHFRRRNGLLLHRPFDARRAELSLRTNVAGKEL